MATMTQPLVARSPIYTSDGGFSLRWRLQALIAQRNLIWELTRRNLRVRYRRSIFGYLWTLANPLLNTIVFTLVFSVLLKTTIPRFSLFFIAGLMPWNAFSTSVLESMSIVTGSAHLVTKVRFPHEVLPISTVLTNMISFVLALPSIFLLMIVTHTPLAPQLILLPWVLLCLFCFTLGVSFLSAAVNVFFRDTRNFLDVVMTLWFFLTPIIYNIDAVFVSPRGQRLVYWLNPVASLVTLFRHMFYTSYWDNVTFLARTSVACFLALIVGWLCFARLSPRFVEEL